MGRLARGLSRRSLIALPVLVALTAGVGPAGAAQAGADHGMHKPADQPATPSAAAYRPYAQLSSVSCPSVRWCVAVGFHTIGSGPALYPLAEAWNGRSWRLLKAPVIHGMFLGIACPRVRACIAVGGRANRDGIQAHPLAATWNGRSWRLRRTAH